MTQKQKGASQYIEDVIFITRTGVGFVAFPDKKDGEVRIENRLLNTALNGDFVRVLVYPKKDEKQRSGEIEKIIARAKETFVGTLYSERGVVTVRPQDSRFYTHIVIPREESKGAKEGEKVLVKIVEWKTGKDIPLGSIIEVLGKKGEHETEIQAILRDRGIIDEFPNAVEEETRMIVSKYTERLIKELPTRRDMRKTLTCTIDPEDAKDFDDALSIQKLSNGNYEVGVHIADVSFFVRKGMALDIEAARRSNSLYLVDRTIPMLPSALSNDLCSLKPNEDRLTFGAVFEMTPLGIVKNRWFGKTIIHSNKRFTYEEAQGVLLGKSGNWHAELSVLNTMAKHIRAKREDEGALSFDHDEVKFELDAKGVPLRVFRKKSFDTNKLIEEFMILANREVAQYMSAKNPHIQQSFIYRVHDLPDADKIKELERVMRALGYEITLRKKNITSKDIANLLKQVKGAPHEEMVHMLTVRALAKAIYTTKNIGHFGLSLKHYTHFTSPIRRYPDLVVHRLLLKNLQKEKVSLEDLRRYEAVSRYATQAEISAQEAERASVKYKQSEYMAARVGHTFDGIITGLTERGIFVSEAETLSEGMVSLRDIGDDYYMYDEKKVAIIGRKTKKKYSLGDKVRIKVKKVDVEARLIDYIFT
ncbi:MAG: ribonuclease R [Parcubacteria group bacterium]|nr:ribonuclease R [Parcubacteria group bacterium]